MKDSPTATRHPASSAASLHIRTAETPADWQVAHSLLGGGARSPLKIDQLKTLRDAVKALTPVDVGLLSAHSAIKVRREWVEKTCPENEHQNTRSFISSLSPEQAVRLGRAVREHWSVENKNHHKRDHHVWQEDRHRHRRVNVAQNLALTRNGLLAIIPFDEKNNLPALIVDYQDRKQLAIDLILKTSGDPALGSISVVAGNLVPEPGSALLIGVAGCAYLARRRRD